MTKSNQNHWFTKELHVSVSEHQGDHKRWSWVSNTPGIGAIWGEQDYQSREEKSVESSWEPERSSGLQQRDITNPKLPSRNKPGNIQHCASPYPVFDLLQWPPLANPGWHPEGKGLQCRTDLEALRQRVEQKRVRVNPGDSQKIAGPCLSDSASKATTSNRHQIVTCKTSRRHRISPILPCISLCLFSFA